MSMSDKAKTSAQPLKDPAFIAFCHRSQLIAGLIKPPTVIEKGVLDTQAAGWNDFFKESGVFW
jgi:hypothetical protein